MKSGVSSSIKLLALVSILIPSTLLAEEKFQPPVTWSDPTGSNTSQVFNPGILSNDPAGLNTLDQADLTKMRELRLADPANLVGAQASPQPAAQACPRIAQNDFQQYAMKQKNLINLRTQELRLISSVEISAIVTHINPIQQHQWVIVKDSLGCSYEFNFQEHSAVLKQFETLQAALTNPNTYLILGVTNCSDRGICFAEIVGAKQMVR